MKKLLLVLGMITCMLGLAACSTKESVVDNYGVTEEIAIEYAAGLIHSINEIVITGQEAQYKSEPVLTAALENFKAALPELGDFQSVIETTVIYDDGIKMPALKEDINNSATLSLVTFLLLIS